MKKSLGAVEEIVADERAAGRQHYRGEPERERD